MAIRLVKPQTFRQLGLKRVFARIVLLVMFTVIAVAIMAALISKPESRVVLGVLGFVFLFMWALIEA